MLYLAAIVLAFFLSFLLLTKKNKTSADYLLFAWLAITGFHLLTYYLMSNGQYENYPGIIALGFPLPLVQGPFLYLYTIRQTSPAAFHPKHLLHFLPVIISYLLFAEFFLLTADQKTEVFRNKGDGYETVMAINLYAVYLSGIVYVILTLARLSIYRKQMVQTFSNTDKINFNWLLYLVLWVAAVWIAVLFIQDDRFIFGAAALFVLWLGYFGIRQVQVFTRPLSKIHYVTDAQTSVPNQAGSPPALSSVTTESNKIIDTFTYTKYQRSSLTKEEAGMIHKQLLQLMHTEKPFTDPDLTLNDLAGKLSVNPNHLSQVINTKEAKSFYDLVNENRVEEFIRLSKQSGSQQYTLLGLAFDCGFNSKASFNRNFKKYTGMTPSEYLAHQRTELTDAQP